MTNEQNRAFDKLRKAWLNHHDLKMRRASIADLTLSRTMLEDARISAHRSLR